jgi:hypothetical protein
MHDLDGYILKRAMAVDDAKADGSYDNWAELQVDLPRDILGPLLFLARKKGTTVASLIAAIAEKEARDDLKAFLDS